MTLTARQLEAKKRWRENNPDYNKQYFEKNKEKVKQQLREKYQDLKSNEPWKLAVRRAKHRAKANGLEFNLTDEYVKSIWVDECPVLKIKLFSADFEKGLSRSESKAKPQDNSPTIDRIDSNKGYVVGNVCIMSYRANMIKNCGTIEEHKAIINFLEKQHT